MGKNWKIFLAVGAIVILAGLGSIFVIGKDKSEDISSQDGAGKVAGVVSDRDNDYIARLAKHLASNGMVLYGSDLSVETKQQIDLFGNSAKDIDYVDCDVATSSSNPDECIGQNIAIYPTWVYNGVKYEGVQILSELAKITNFEQ